MSNTTAILRGRLTRDPEIKQVGVKSTTLATFSVACDEMRGGEKVVDFFECESWGSTAESLQGMAKGDPIAVFGRMKQDKWLDAATQQKRSKVVIVAEIIDGVARTPKTAAAATSTHANANTGYDDTSLPF